MTRILSAARAGDAVPERTSPTRRPRRLLKAALVSDAVALALAATTQAFAAFAGAGRPVPAWAAAFAATVLVLHGAGGLYTERPGRDVFDVVRSIVVRTTTAAALVISLDALLAGGGAAGAVARTAGLAAVLLLVGRVVLHQRETASRRRGTKVRKTLIVGAGRVGCVVARRLANAPQIGLQPIGFLDKDPLYPPEAYDLDLPVLGATWDLEAVVREHDVDHVVVAFSTAPNDVLLRLLDRCTALGVSVSLVPRLFEKVTGRVSVAHVGGIPLLTAEPADPTTDAYYAVKYAADRVVAGLLVLAVLPVLAVSALAIFATMGRPILFRQRRVGFNGVEFDILKFRTMRTGPADSAPVELGADTAPGGVEGEDRRTRLGAVLRATSIDELPQLFNVLRGEMSLVGPRPERPEYVRQFNGTVYRYDDRHRVKSGITGWAQVHGLRGKTSLSDRVEWDNFYIENCSPWLDVKILLATPLAVLRILPDIE